jgi:hypothetical protein
VLRNVRLARLPYEEHEGFMSDPRFVRLMDSLMSVMRQHPQELSCFQLADIVNSECEIPMADIFIAVVEVM